MNKLHKRYSARELEYKRAWEAASRRHFPYQPGFLTDSRARVAIRVEFDQATGLPLSIWSDPIPEAADDELGVLVSGFTAAP